MSAARLDSRLRAGTAVHAWPAGPRDDPAAGGLIVATVADARVCGDDLSISLTVGASATLPADGTALTMRPSPAAPGALMEARRRYERLYRTQTSWLTTGRSPGLRRRDVPLDVLVAAADDEPERG